MKICEICKEPDIKCCLGINKKLFIREIMKLRVKTRDKILPKLNKIKLLSFPGFLIHVFADFHAICLKNKKVIKKTVNRFLTPFTSYIRKSCNKIIFLTKVHCHYEKYFLVVRSYVLLNIVLLQCVD